MSANASSEDAWSEFRKNVKHSCQALLNLPKKTPFKIEIDPFGSDRFGLALITTGTGKNKERRMCVYDKQTKKVELGSPF
ncbi:hypothetical protein R4483_07385 [Acinetobacter baumannii]|uniref:hypothetical protein n=1 Tax=Acinetobacter calcoaceticus/baumannii complex TaxID=909768 RepID=UPI000837FD5C|nr:MULTISPECIES: hypothetical protein [Acinetobacter calcoaceticus/baumannii complex]HCC93124.1 hypothetical protein [Flavobacteriaceae bacterium]MDH2526536.1 hypothetical protein [Acinetobacter baumannii]MDV7432887.1 hypothetical protein [Acinetobacter baumannii]OCY52359.1 hypothetical protein BFR81_08875 [Acinetobacter pittii]HCW3749223.1 hypothetical protein [Acinetobacter baumannii]